MKRIISFSSLLTLTVAILFLVTYQLVHGFGVVVDDDDGLQSRSSGEVQDVDVDINNNDSTDHNNNSNSKDDDQSDMCPCVQRDSCPRFYGQSALDIRELGFLPPCLEFGTVRCCGITISTDKNVNVKPDPTLPLSDEEGVSLSDSADVKGDSVSADLESKSKSPANDGDLQSSASAVNSKVVSSPSVHISSLIKTQARRRKIVSPRKTSNGTAATVDNESRNDEAKSESESNSNADSDSDIKTDSSSSNEQLSGNLNNHQSLDTLKSNNNGNSSLKAKQPRILPGTASQYRASTKSRIRPKSVPASTSTATLTSNPTSNSNPNAIPIPSSFPISEKNLTLPRQRLREKSSLRPKLPPVSAFSPNLNLNSNNSIPTRSSPSKVNQNGKPNLNLNLNLSPKKSIGGENPSIASQPQPQKHQQRQQKQQTRAPAYRRKEMNGQLLNVTEINYNSPIYSVPAPNLSPMSIRAKQQMQLGSTPISPNPIQSPSQSQSQHHIKSARPFPHRKIPSDNPSIGKTEMTIPIPMPFPMPISIPNPNLEMTEEKTNQVPIVSSTLNLNLNLAQSPPSPLPPPTRNVIGNRQIFMRNRTAVTSRASTVTPIASPTDEPVTEPTPISNTNLKSVMRRRRPGIKMSLKGSGTNNSSSILESHGQAESPTVPAPGKSSVYMNMNMGKDQSSFSTRIKSHHHNHEEEGIPPPEIPSPLPQAPGFHKQPQQHFGHKRQMKNRVRFPNPSETPSATVENSGPSSGIIPDPIPIPVSVVLQQQKQQQQQGEKEVESPQPQQSESNNNHNNEKEEEKTVEDFSIPQEKQEQEKKQETPQNIDLESVSPTSLVQKEESSPSLSSLAETSIVEDQKQPSKVQFPEESDQKTLDAEENRGGEQEESSLNSAAGPHKTQPIDAADPQSSSSSPSEFTFPPFAPSVSSLSPSSSSSSSSVEEPEQESQPESHPENEPESPQESFSLPPSSPSSATSPGKPHKVVKTVIRNRPRVNGNRNGNEQGAQGERERERGGRVTPVKTISQYSRIRTTVTNGDKNVDTLTQEQSQTQMQSAASSNSGSISESSSVSSSTSSSSSSSSSSSMLPNGGKRRFNIPNNIFHESEGGSEIGSEVENPNPNPSSLSHLGGISDMEKLSDSQNIRNRGREPMRQPMSTQQQRVPTSNVQDAQQESYDLILDKEKRKFMRIPPASSAAAQTVHLNSNSNAQPETQTHSHFIRDHNNPNPSSSFNSASSSSSYPHHIRLSSNNLLPSSPSSSLSHPSHPLDIINVNSVANEGGKPRLPLSSSSSSQTSDRFVPSIVDDMENGMKNSVDVDLNQATRHHPASAGATVVHNDLHMRPMHGPKQNQNQNQNQFNFQENVNSNSNPNPQENESGSHHNNNNHPSSHNNVNLESAASINTISVTSDTEHRGAIKHQQYLDRTKDPLRKRLRQRVRGPNFASTGPPPSMTTMSSLSPSSRIRMRQKLSSRPPYSNSNSYTTTSAPLNKELDYQVNNVIPYSNSNAENDELDSTKYESITTEKAPFVFPSFRPGGVRTEEPVTTRTTVSPSSNSPSPSSTYISYQAQQNEDNVHANVENSNGWVATVAAVPVPNPISHSNSNPNVNNIRQGHDKNRVISSYQSHSNPNPNPEIQRPSSHHYGNGNDATRVNYNGVSSIPPSSSSSSSSQPQNAMKYSTSENNGWEVSRPSHSYSYTGNSNPGNVPQQQQYEEERSTTPFSTYQVQSTEKSHLRFQSATPTSPLTPAAEQEQQKYQHYPQNSQYETESLNLKSTSNPNVRNPSSNIRGNPSGDNRPLETYKRPTSSSSFSSPSSPSSQSYQKPRSNSTRFSIPKTFQLNQNGENPNYHESKNKNIYNSNSNNNDAEAHKSTATTESYRHVQTTAPAPEKVNRVRYHPHSHSHGSSSSSHSTENPSMNFQYNANTNSNTYGTVKASSSSSSSSTFENSSFDKKPEHFQVHSQEQAQLKHQNEREQEREREGQREKDKGENSHNSKQVEQENQNSVGIPSSKSPIVRPFSSSHSFQIGAGRQQEEKRIESTQPRPQSQSPQQQQQQTVLKTPYSPSTASTVKFGSGSIVQELAPQTFFHPVPLPGNSNSNPNPNNSLYYPNNTQVQSQQIQIQHHQKQQGQSGYQYNNNPNNKRPISPVQTPEASKPIVGPISSSPVPVPAPVGLVSKTPPRLASPITSIKGTPGFSISFSTLPDGQTISHPVPPIVAKHFAEQFAKEQSSLHVPAQAGQQQQSVLKPSASSPSVAIKQSPTNLKIQNPPQMAVQPHQTPNQLHYQQGKEKQQKQKYQPPQQQKPEAIVKHNPTHAIRPASPFPPQKPMGMSQPNYIQISNPQLAQPSPVRLAPNHYQNQNQKYQIPNNPPVQHQQLLQNPPVNYAPQTMQQNQYNPRPLSHNPNPMANPNPNYNPHHRVFQQQPQQQSYDPQHQAIRHNIVNQLHHSMMRNSRAMNFTDVEEITNNSTITLNSNANSTATVLDDKNLNSSASDTSVLTKVDDNTNTNADSSAQGKVTLDGKKEGGSPSSNFVNININNGGNMDLDAESSNNVDIVVKASLSSPASSQNEADSVLPLVQSTNTNATLQLNAEKDVNGVNMNHMNKIIAEEKNAQSSEGRKEFKEPRSERGFFPLLPYSEEDPGPTLVRIPKSRVMEPVKVEESVKVLHQITEPVLDAKIQLQQQKQ